MITLFSHLLCYNGIVFDCGRLYQTGRADKVQTMIANFLVELHVPQAMANKLKVSSLLVIILNNGKRIQWALRIKESVDYEGKMSHQWATRAKGVINGLPGQKESSMDYQGKRSHQ